MRKDSYINRMIQIVLDIADLADIHGEDGTAIYVNELGLGCRALSGYLRRGVKEIIDLQNDYHGAKIAEKIAKDSEADMQDFLNDMFGIDEPQSINEQDKERIRALCRQIQRAWDEKEEI